MNTLRRTVQKALRSMGILERVRGSRAYDLYWTFADPQVLQRRSEEVAFYRSLLEDMPREPLIFDVGANQGAKTDVFLRMGARVIAVDPDASNQRVIAERFLHYRLRSPRVQIVPCALAEQAGVGTFFVDAPGSGKNTLSTKWVELLRDDATRFGQRLTFGEQRQVETRTLEDLIEAFGQPYFIKVDVEGAEARVIGGLRRPPRYLSFEVNLPEFLPEGLQCVRLLQERAGSARFNYSPGSDCRLALPRWENARAMEDALTACREESVEVFFRAD